MELQTTLFYIRYRIAFRIIRLKWKQKGKKKKLILEKVYDKTGIAPLESASELQLQGERNVIGSILNF